MKLNAKNERIKRRYFQFLKEAKRHSERSIDAAAKALDRFETYTRRRDFAKFHIEQATGFKRHLAGEAGVRSQAPLSKSTQLHTLAALRAFFVWLADQQGYKSKIGYTDAEYFNLSLKDAAIAKADHGDVKGPTIEQVRHVLATMPGSTDIERRNRALVAFTLLSGARDDAIASLRLGDVDLAAQQVRQDARHVRTKASKSMTTYFFPVGDDIRQIVEEWIGLLRTERAWGLEDPLFPATLVAVGAERRFEAKGLDRRFWSTATPIRKVFRDAFTAAGLPNFNPHSFRNTLARLGLAVTGTPEEFKAWTQNLGHENAATTWLSYGELDRQRQAEIIRKLGQPKARSDGDTDALARQIAEFMRSR